MNSKIKAKYQKTIDAISGNGAFLSKEDYEEYIEEVLGHVKGLQECIEEEKEGLE